MSSNTLVSQNLEVIKSIEVSGFPIEVGILQDGTPFLSGRGLARACGISNSTLVGWGETTPQLGESHRAGKMANLLATYSYEGDRFFFKIPDGSKFEGKANVSAYPYKVCMAFLDYYAFEANKEEARNSLRILSEKQLPQFILAAVNGATEATAAPIKPTPRPARVRESSPFETRPLRDGIPIGYFTVAQLFSGELARSLQAALNLDSFTVSPSNIARAWNHYWDIQKLWEQHGERFLVPDRETDYFPQAKSYVYPLSALDEFKQWLNLEYIPDRFPSYLQRKIKQRAFLAAYRNQLPQAS
jgi:hypothetical protein